MKSRYLAMITALAGAAAVPAHAALAVGEAAPDFTATASEGGQAFDFHLYDALKKGPVVLYFFPASFTEGCTIEAHDFADAIDSFRALGATVIGVSRDDIDTQKRFSLSECRGKFAVAADPQRIVMKSYDASMPLLPYANRISYVISPAGKVAYEYSSMSPDKHVTNTLEAVRALSTRGAPASASRTPAPR